VALGELSGERLSAIPYSGPWTAQAVGGLFELVAGLARPATLIANVATRHLWGASPSAGQLLAYLLDGSPDGPPADWDVGHFVCVIGRLSGPRGTSMRWPTPTRRWDAAACTCSRRSGSRRRSRGPTWRPAA